MKTNIFNNHGSFQILVWSSIIDLHDSKVLSWLPIWMREFYNNILIGKVEFYRLVWRWDNRKSSNSLFWIRLSFLALLYIDFLVKIYRLYITHGKNFRIKPRLTTVSINRESQTVYSVFRNWSKPQCRNTVVRTRTTAVQMAKN